MFSVNCVCCKWSEHRRVTALNYTYAAEAFMVKWGGCAFLQMEPRQMANYSNERKQLDNWRDVWVRLVFVFFFFTTYESRKIFITHLHV